MNCYKTHSIRSANVVGAHMKTYQHPTNPLLRAVARNAKLSLGDGRYDVARVFYVKAKIGNRWVFQTPGTNKANAERVFGAPIHDFS